MQLLFQNLLHMSIETALLARQHLPISLYMRKRGKLHHSLVKGPGGTKEMSGIMEPQVTGVLISIAHDVDLLCRLRQAYYYTSGQSVHSLVHSARNMGVAALRKAQALSRGTNISVYMFESRNNRSADN